MSQYPCPACGNDTQVLNSRWSVRFHFARRRRCLKCDHRFSTVEIDLSLYSDLRRRTRAASKVVRSHLRRLDRIIGDVT